MTISRIGKSGRISGISTCVPLLSGLSTFHSVSSLIWAPMLRQLNHSRTIGQQQTGRPSRFLQLSNEPSGTISKLTEIWAPGKELTEQFLHFIKEAFGERIDLFAAKGGEFLQQFFLLGCEVGRRFNCHPHMLIALLKSLHVFDTFAFHAKDLA